MAKLIKVIVLLGILVAAVALYVHFSSGSKSKSDTPTAKPAAKTDGPPQVQEKYGFAPVGQ